MVMGVFQIRKGNEGQVTKKKSTFREYLEAIVVAIILALFIRVFVVQAFRIPSSSMEDTLLVGDFLLVNKFIYGAEIPFANLRLPAIREPKPGDIIVFETRGIPGLVQNKDFIKRCIAVGGQTVEVRDKVVYVDGRPVPDPPLAKHVRDEVLPRRYSPRDNFGPVRVPEGCLFMMGDNRDNSRDSRYWGWLPKENIKGRAFILYWSWNPKVPWYDLIHKVRWHRIGDLVK